MEFRNLSYSLKRVTWIYVAERKNSMTSVFPSTFRRKNILWGYFWGSTVIPKDWGQQASSSGEFIGWTDSDIAQWSPMQLFKKVKEKNPCINRRYIGRRESRGSGPWCCVLNCAKKATKDGCSSCVSCIFLQKHPRQTKHTHGCLTPLRHFQKKHCWLARGTSKAGGGVPCLSSQSFGRESSRTKSSRSFFNDTASSRLVGIPETVFLKKGKKRGKTSTSYMY